MRLRWLLLALLLAALPARAALMFGTDEKIRFIANTTLKGPAGEQLYLARRVAFKNFIAPYAFEDRGYVLGVSGEPKAYFKMPEGERLEAMQAAGFLPKPLPPYELDGGDLFFGHLLWYLLAALALYLAYLWFRSKPAPAAAGASPAPALLAYAGPEIRLPTRLLPSRGKILLMLLGSLAFVAGGVFMGSKDPLMGYGGAAFFGLCAAVFVIQLIPGSAYLDIDRDGFTFAGMFRKNRVAWADVAGFGVISVSRNKMVGWNYSPGYAKQPVGRALASALSGAQGALPDTYGMKAEALADLLNECKRRAA